MIWWLETFKFLFLFDKNQKKRKIDKQIFNESLAAALTGNVDV